MYKKAALLLASSLLLNTAELLTPMVIAKPRTNSSSSTDWIAENGSFHVMVWLNDIDYSLVDDEITQTLGFSWADIEQQEKNAYEAAQKRVFQKNISLKTDFEMYDAQLLSELEVCSEMASSLINAERTISRRLYEEHNNAIIDSMDLSDEIEYVSKYTPTFIATLTLEQVYALKTNDSVDTISQIANDVATPADNDSDSQHEPRQTNSTDYLSYINATIPKSNGLTGSGIKIGLMDFGIVSSSSHSELSSSNIIGVGTSSNSYIDHAIDMSRIICGSNGVAPGCTLYSAGFDAGNLADYINKMELLLSQNVNIINCSLSWERNTSISDYYTDAEKWTDHISPSHHVTVITAAGNSNSIDTTPISSPGLAYNSITIGNANYATNTMDGMSRYLYNGGVRKPDVVAPGAGVLGSSGTSAATACVSGMSALILQNTPGIASSPVTLKAVILAGCSSYVGGGSPTSGYNTKQGAGLVNCKNSIDILNAGNYYVNYITSNGTFSHNISYSSPGLHTAAFAGLKVNTETSGGGITVHNMPNTAFVFDNGLGTALASDIAGNASARIVRYGSVANTYTLKLTVTSIPSPGLLYAFAWR